MKLSELVELFKDEIVVDGRTEYNQAKEFALKHKVKLTHQQVWKVVNAAKEVDLDEVEDDL